ncbi:MULTISPECIES: RagB/SusD family nutrient uptake outer membrane protein [unclassified Arcicella]|uniref:RagB/SusD family nutrient uptake outer membrane protein n=1 Tax=unclassified Arcicella TaxID=2644986 RepID=UPI002859C421|nr:MULTISPECIES: RagB/SusD family nutrient uptake outer membrane protein [unclassified Arcicella]MDR6562813.1 hypothetical protein [Arcicella sp. BE51]MDR6812845.1 hypothetical protein [Arcicella sp. BE140]MDR6824157.1 hypothetical protein [Arcicella sp. BE139]
MKLKHTFSAFLLGITAFAFSGCQSVLDETPRTAFTIDYFKTQDGLQSAIYTAYAGLRYDFGPIGAMVLGNVGTDEFTYGDQGASGQTLECGIYSISPTNGAIGTPWNRNYSNINLCNAVVEFAPNVTMDATNKSKLLGEARYLRAMYYLLLVENFGAVPLDLGSGDLKFNSTPSCTFRRNDPDLLKKNFQSMIDDLLFATENLPDQRPAGEYRLAKGAALHLLARVYTYRAYSAVKQATDFQSAYDTAKKLIDGKAKYGTDLLQDFGDIHKEGNDYNKEILFAVERLPLNNIANEVVNPSSDFDQKVNISCNMFVSNYTSVTKNGVTLFPVRVLQYGRPLRQFCPTRWTLDVAFADKLNDSRFNNTFRDAYPIATFYTAGSSDYTKYVADMAAIGFALGDTAFYIAPTDAIAKTLKAANKKYVIYSPSETYSNQNRANNIYPALRKYEAVNRNSYQDISGRPFVASKFSEVYLLAAEAAMALGKNAEAAQYINVLRDRAAYRSGLSATELANRRAKIQVSASDITLDFILDERTRELCGESIRWPDLAMRGKLVDRAKKYNPDVTNLQSFHLLRPIPQSQLDATCETVKSQYQNPGYN